jgi:hypothetical protein
MNPCLSQSACVSQLVIIFFSRGNYLTICLVIAFQRKSGDLDGDS